MDSSQAPPDGTDHSPDPIAPGAPVPVRIFHIETERLAEIDSLPAQLPEAGFLWIGIARPALPDQLVDLQRALARWQIGEIVDLHVSDLLNAQLPSHFDDTSWYDMLVFRRLAGAPLRGLARSSAAMPLSEPPRGAETLHPLLVDVDTSPVGFVVYDRVLVTVHPDDCAVRELFARRLPMVARSDAQRTGGLRLPTGPADLMLRMVNVLVDNYLDLRRRLSRQMTVLQQELLAPQGRVDWTILLTSRDALYGLEDICEDQRSAIQEWIDVLDERPRSPSKQQAREDELLRVRSRDVLEHIGRVLSHVDRLQHSVESAVQMHFSAIGQRTNDIMRTLTVLTAVFLPLNLITGFFGMNFEGLPLIHSHSGVWIALSMMVVIAVALSGFFIRRRYLGERAQRRLEAGLAKLDLRGGNGHGNGHVNGHVNGHGERAES